MKRILIVFGALLIGAVWLSVKAKDDTLRVALDRYDQAVRTKDLETVKSLLSTDIVVYEHSVRNLGLQDAYENHLKPEISEFENLKMEFSNVRTTVGNDVAVVTREYHIQGKLEGKEIDASGNESMAWKKNRGRWRIFHIHYSHPCPKPTAATQ